MRYEDEKDYIMRMIKEMVRVLFSLMLGKHYTQVELPKENKYSVAGTGLDEFRAMVDRGEVNEAENILLDTLDYSDREALAAAVLFYEYVAGKGDTFLEEHNYSLEEAYDVLRQIARRTGYGEIVEDLSRI